MAPGSVNWVDLLKMWDGNLVFSLLSVSYKVCGIYLYTVPGDLPQSNKRDHLHYQKWSNDHSILYANSIYMWLYSVLYSCSLGQSKSLGQKDADPHAPSWPLLPGQCLPKLPTETPPSRQTPWSHETPENRKSSIKPPRLGFIFHLTNMYISSMKSKAFFHSWSTMANAQAHCSARSQALTTFGWWPTNSGSRFGLFHPHPPQRMDHLMAWRRNLKPPKGWLKWTSLDSNESKSGAKFKNFPLNPVDGQPQAFSMGFLLDLLTPFQKKTRFFLTDPFG